MQIDSDWLNEESVKTLFQEFPFPMMLVHADGSVGQFNRRFETDYRPELLEQETIKKLIKKASSKPFETSMQSRDGQEVTAQVHAIPIAERTLLVFEDPSSPADNDEVRSLKERMLELESLSITDRLTGAWNRLHLERTTEVEINRCQRYRQPVSLILLDIDHFKRINDGFGHNIGDAVLKEFVQLIRRSIRASDSVYRWGGEEFVVLGIATSKRTAAVLADKVRHAIANHSFEKVGRVTTSCGVAEYLPGDDLDAWFQRADKALYQAKETGRNRVVTNPFGGSDVWSKEEGESIAKLVWHDYFESGEPTIDSQHRGLFEQANRLISLSLKDVGQEQFLPQLDELLEHVTRHFNDEEEILRARGYEDLELHREQHRQLVRRALALKEDTLAGHIRPGKLFEFLAHQVVAQHMLTEDRKFYGLFEVGSE